MRAPIFTAVLSALVLTVSTVRAADGWLDDFEKAKTQAAKENRDLLLDFTGSDWCHWCIQLDEEVFSKDAFKLEAPKHFVLVELDFPQGKELPEATRKQNEKLQAEFRVEGFPTIVLADAQGRPYAFTGYEAGGPAKYLEHLAGLKKVRTARDEGLKKAAAAEGVDKAKAIAAALKGIDRALVHQYYVKELDEAIAADKDDSTGLKKERAELAARRAYEDKMAALSDELSELHAAEKFDDFAKRVDAFIEAEKLTGERRQECLMNKLGIYGPDKLKEAEKLIDEVIAIDPKSEMAEQAKVVKESLQEMAKQVDKSKREFEGEDEPMEEKAEEKAEEK